MTKESLDFEKLLPLLQQIYDKQHYFIDRHEVMGEKLLNILVLTGGLVSIVFALAEKIPKSGPWRCGFLILIILFFILFFVSYFSVSRAIRPLSSKASSQLDSTLLPLQNKEWITDSRIYYRGIISRANKSMNDECDPLFNLMKSMSVEELCYDFSQQIIILAHYSDYKRKQLEKATKWTTSMIFIGILLLMFCAILTYF